MSEWKKVRLGDVVSLVIDHRGKTPKKLGGDWAESGYRALSAKTVKTRQIVNEDSIRFVGETMYREWMKDEIQRGDILVTSEAPYGEVYYWDSDEKIVLSQRLFGLRIKPEYDSAYVAQYMTTTSFKQEMDARATGTTVFGLRQPELLECKLMLPPLPTQRKIAAVLSSLDDKIENNRKICANLEAQAQAIFKSWFVDFEPFGGKMPQGWKMGKLGDVADITMGQSPDGKSLNDVGDGITFFQGRAEFGNRYPTKRLSTTEPKRMAKEGDVLLSVRAPVGDLNIALENCCIGRGLAAIRAKTECADQDVARPPRPCGKGEGALATSRRCQSFIYCLLRSMKPQFDLYEGAGTIFGSINKDSLHGLSCLVPDEKALQEFEGVVSSFDSLYRERELESRSLAATRDALLPKLMSGEIDVEKVKVA